MLTILESLKLSEEYLAKKKIDSPRINSEMLLADILRCKRLDLYLKFDQPLSEKEIRSYREYISRRGKGEPLQYITGKVEFYGLSLKVNPSVLIPRPETELLVETIINENSLLERLKVLDIGCGAGNITIALAKYLHNPKIYAIDISDEAIHLAKENSIKFETDDIIEFINMDIMKDDILNYKNNFDIVVSNPPYVNIKEYNTLQKEIKEFEPAVAVTDFTDGYKFYKRITSISKKILKPNGRIYFEMAKGQSKKIETILDADNFQAIQVIKDYSGIDRIIRGEKL